MLKYLIIFSDQTYTCMLCCKKYRTLVFLKKGKIQVYNKKKLAFHQHVLVMCQNFTEHFPFI